MRIVCLSNETDRGDARTIVDGLARALAARGLNVLMLDLQPDALFAMRSGRTEVFDLYADERSLSIEETIDPTTAARIGLAPSQVQSAALERIAAALPNLGHTLLRAFTDAHLPYDYVLFHCPASLRGLAMSGLAAADLVMLPTQTDASALDALDVTLHTVATIERSRDQALPALVLPTSPVTEIVAQKYRQFGCMLWQNEAHGAQKAPADAHERLACWLLGEGANAVRAAQLVGRAA